MNVKIFKGHGSGNVGGAIDYLLANEDHMGRERAMEPRILSGDPERMQQVCDSMRQKNKYVAGGLMFSEILTDEQKLHAMQSFEDHHFPGMEGRYEILWIEHNDHNRTELNFVIAKVDLETGLAYNPFPGNERNPMWQHHTDPWRDAYNIENGYSRPDVPTNLSTKTSEYDIAKFSDSFKDAMRSRNDIIDVVTDYVQNSLVNGSIKSRDDVVNCVNELSEFGIKVEKTSEKFISISVEGRDKNIRLKGAIFDERSFDDTGFKYTHSSEKGREHTGTSSEYESRARAADKARDRRAEYNHERFGATSEVVKFYSEQTRDRIAVNNREPGASKGSEISASNTEKTKDSTVEESKTASSQQAINNSGISVSSGVSPAANNHASVAQSITSEAPSVSIGEGHEYEDGFLYFKRTEVSISAHRRQREKEQAASLKQEQQLIQEQNNVIKQHLARICEYVTADFIGYFSSFSAAAEQSSVATERIVRASESNRRAVSHIETGVFSDIQQAAISSDRVIATSRSIVDGLEETKRHITERQHIRDAIKSFAEVCDQYAETVRSGIRELKEQVVTAAKAPINRIMQEIEQKRNSYRAPPVFDQHAADISKYGQYKPEDIREVRQFISGVDDDTAASLDARAKRQGYSDAMAMILDDNQLDRYQEAYNASQRRNYSRDYDGPEPDGPAPG